MTTPKQINFHSKQYIAISGYICDNDALKFLQDTVAHNDIIWSGFIEPHITNGKIKTDVRSDSYITLNAITVKGNEYYLPEKVWNDIYGYLFIINKSDDKHKEQDLAKNSNEITRNYLSNYLNIVKAKMKEGHKDLRLLIIAFLINTNLGITVLKNFLTNSISLSTAKKADYGDYIASKGLCIPTTRFQTNLAKQLIHVLYQQHPILDKFMGFLNINSAAGRYYNF